MVFSLCYEQTMTKAREGEFLSRYMPYVGTPIIQFQSPRQCVRRSAGPSTGTGIGMPFGVGICQSCSCACAPYIHLPPGINFFFFFLGRESHGELHRRGCDPKSWIPPPTTLIN